MKLKDNLKNFAKYVAKSFNNFAKKISESKSKFIQKTDESLNKKLLEGEYSIKNTLESFYKRMRMVEYNSYNSGLNDVLIISPKNKLDGKTHSIGDNNLTLGKYYDALPSDNFRYNNKPKYKNDDYMLLSSVGEKLEIPYFKCETKILENKFNQWIDDDGNVVRNTGKLMTRNSNGVSMIHTTGLSPSSNNETQSLLTELEPSNLKINHFDYKEHEVKLLVWKNYIDENEKYKIPQDYISLDYDHDYLSVSLNDSWIDNNDGVYYYCLIKVKIIQETYSYFDENEYIIIKTGHENLVLNISRPQIYFESSMFYPCVITEPDGSQVIKDVNIEELDSSYKEKIFVKEPESTDDNSSSDYWIRSDLNGDLISEKGDSITGLKLRIETNIPKDKILLFSEATYPKSINNRDGVEFGDIIEEGENKYMVPVTLSVASDDSIKNRSGAILITVSHKKEDIPIEGIKYNEYDGNVLNGLSVIFIFRFIQGKKNETLPNFNLHSRISVDGRGILSNDIEIGEEYKIVNSYNSYLFLNENILENNYIKSTLKKTTSTKDIYFNSNIGVCKKRVSILILEKKKENENCISILIIEQETSLIPGEDLIPRLSLNELNKKVKEISLNKDQSEINLFLVAPYDEQVKFQNWNPLKCSEKVRLENDTIYNIEYDSFTPSSFNMIYKTTDGISFLLESEEVFNSKDKNSFYTVLPSEDSEYEYQPPVEDSVNWPPPPPTNPNDPPKPIEPPEEVYIVCKKNKWATYATNDEVKKEYIKFKRTSWLSDSEKKVKYCKGILSIDKDSLNEKRNFIILKNFQSKNFPGTKSNIDDNDEFGGFIDKEVSENILTFDEVREKSKLLHFSDCVYVYTNNKNATEPGGTLGPYDVGRFIINNKSNGLNKSYYIKISEILSSKSFILGMQESIAASFNINTSQIEKNLTLRFNIGTIDNSRHLYTINLNLNFNSQEEKQFGTVKVWTVSDVEAFHISYWYHYSIEGTSFKWNLFEGKQFEDEDEIYNELTEYDILNFGKIDLNSSNEDYSVYTMPITIDFIGSDPSIVSEIIVKVYEKIPIKDN